MKTGPIGRDAGDHLGVFVRIGADNALDHEGFPACLHVVRDAAGPKSGKEGFSLRPGIRERRGGLHLTQQPFQRPAAHDNFRVRRSEIPDVGGNFPQWAAVMSGRFNLNGLSGGHAVGPKKVTNVGTGAKIGGKLTGNSVRFNPRLSVRHDDDGNRIRSNERFAQNRPRAGNGQHDDEQTNDSFHGSSTPVGNEGLLFMY